MAYNNEEVFPKIENTEVPNTTIDSVIKGYANRIEKSAKNVIVNGDRNYVGHATSNINIFNSSGCVVSSGVTGCTLINSSGITIYDDNKVYINNVEYGLGNNPPTGAYKIVTNPSSYAIVEGDETLDCQHNSNGLVVGLPSPVGHNREFDIKNNSPLESDLLIFIDGYSIDNETISGAGYLYVSYLDSATVQSDGVSNYIIK